MHILLDKLAATIIATTILVMIFTVNVRNEQTMHETTAFYAMTTATEAFAKILRRDLQGIDQVLTISEVPHADGTTEFRFVSRIGQDTTRHTVIYKKRFLFQRHQKSFYRIERLVDNDPDGGSMDIITTWEIVALNEDAGAISDPDDAAQVYVRFEAASPALDTEIVERVQWESRFFPPLRN